MNKLHSVKPVLGDWQSSYRRCKKDEVVLCRARISHTHLTHSYILRKDPPPLCEHCQCILTVRHILVECNHFAQDALNTFYFRLYGVGHMVKNHSDSDSRNPLLPHGLLFQINSKCSFTLTIPETGWHIPRPWLHQSWITG